jgi:uncharacterized protein YjbJ (UPF0337 family)
MSTENRLEATAKNIAGKAQEFLGDISGNPQDKMEGQAKQTEAQIQHSAENLRNEADMNSTENRVRATTKNVEGKIQEAVGDITGNPQDKMEGRAKQAEAQLRHTVENIKDELK